MVRVAGVDGYRDGWVAVSLVDGHFARATLHATFTEVLDAEPQAVVVAIDIPIGLPEGKRPRPADVEARRFVGPRAASVFPTPPREALEAPTYTAAIEACRRLTGVALSRQSYALRHRILDVERLADHRVHEVHPEVSFRAMAGQPLPLAKRSGGGALLRLRLLEGEGIRLAADLGDAGAAPLHDLLDAAAAAWSAHRIATRQAGTLPVRPPSDRRGRPVAIWY